MATPADIAPAPAVEADPTEDAPTVDATPADEPLGENGKKALERERAARKAAEAERAKLLTEAEELREFRAKAEGREAEYEAERNARAFEADALTKANARLVRAEAKALLAGRVHSIDASLTLLGDLGEIPVTDDGDVDAQALTAKVDGLLEKYDFLAVARDERQFQGRSDAGAREADTKSEEQQLEEGIAAATTAGNHTLSIQLKQRLAAIKREPKKG